MNQYDFEQKLKTMLFDHQEFLFDECKRLFNCGGVDPEEFENDYLLPKIILYVSLENLKDQCIPLDKDAKKIAKNLEKF